MDNQELKYIKSIDIKGLWNRLDVHWDLNDDVNILVGENGTGKSTMLRSVVELFNSINEISKGFNIYLNDKAKELKVQYYHQGKDFLFKLGYSGTNSVISVSINDKLQLRYSTGKTLKDKDKEEFETLYQTYKPDFINTFDAPIPYLNGNGKAYLKTNLDVELDILEKEFITYRFKKLRSLINDKAALKSETYFYNTINRLFEPTGKQLNREDEKLSFITSDNNNLHWSELSSGEKQFLIILMTVLCQDEKPSVLIMDEPEISLHLRWQYELIEIIRTLNPHCQLLIATHSPSIYGKGWRDKVKFIKEIIPQMQQQLA